jgi:uncharacterized membrane protein YccC
MNVARKLVAFVVALILFALLAKPLQILLSVVLIMFFELAFGDSTEVAENAEAIANIAGLFLAGAAAFGIYRLIAGRKPKPTAELPATGTQ